MTIGELIDYGGESPDISGDAMRWKPGSVLELIDSALADCTSNDAMRWAPDAPDPTPAFRTAEFAFTYDTTPITAAFERFGQVFADYIEAITPALDNMVRAWKVFVVEIEAAEAEQRVRLRRLHSEYHRRQRRRRS